MNHKFLPLILALFLGITTAAAQTWNCGKPASGTTPTSAVTATLSGGTLTINGSGAMADFTGNSLPSWYIYCGSISKVVINSGVTSIGNYAFVGCSSLTEVTIPNSVTSIGESAFFSCSGLPSVTIGEAVTSIGRDAFSGCNSIETLNYNAINCSILNNAFYYRTSLKTLTILCSVNN